MFGLSRLAVQLIASSAIVTLLVGSCVVRDRSIEQRGATKVVSASQKAGAKANAINAKVRDDARKPGSLERLRKSSCRDC